MELLNKLVYAEPGNTDAKALLAGCFEQLGYQYESASMRNIFLTGAQELRSGAPDQLNMTAGTADVFRALTASQWWDAVGIRVDSREAEDIEFKLNFIMPDVGKTFVIEMSNATLTNIEGFVAADADATLTIDRADLLPVMMQQATLGEQIQAGKAEVSGNAYVLYQLRSTLVEFDPAFEIIPGTR